MVKKEGKGIPIPPNYETDDEEMKKALSPQMGDKMSDAAKVQFMRPEDFQPMPVAIAKPYTIGDYVLSLIAGAVFLVSMCIIIGLSIRIVRWITNI